MGASFWRQLRAVLWKNLLLKRANLGSTIFEVVIPVLFMGLLVWIKTICNQYDSPSVAFHCGQTDGFDYYVDDLRSYPDLQSNPLAQCLMVPEGCTTPNYYTNGLPAVSLPDSNTSIPQLYMGYGYTSPAIGYPWYGVTVGDESSVYRELNALIQLAETSRNISVPVAAAFANPSPPMAQVLSAYAKANALLAVCPQSTSEPELVAAARELHDQILADAPTPAGLRWFESEASLVSYVTQRAYEDQGFTKVASAIVMQKADRLAMKWEYAIRTNFTQNFELDQPTVGCLCPECGCGQRYPMPPTHYPLDPYTQPPSAKYLYAYTFNAFATLHKYVDDFVLNATAPGTTTTISLGLFPEAAFHADNFLLVIAAFLALVFVIAYLYPVSRFIRALVLEKETKIKETMKIMGLSSLAYSVSWFLTMTTQLTVTALLMTALGSRNVFEYSDAIWIFVFLLSFGVAVVMFCFLVSTFFSKSKTAATLGTVLFFAAFFVYYAVTGPRASTGVKAAACLLAPTCLGLGSDVIAAFEGGLIGLHRDNLGTMPGETNFSYNLTIVMLWVDALLYGLLTAYLEQVLPSDYGTQRPFYFPLLPSFWSGCLPQRPLQRFSSMDSEEMLQTALLPDPQEAGCALEEVDGELRRQEAEGRALSIRSLRKVFKTTGADRVAVEGLNLTLYEGQITVLLGHNGAGKSTTISMLTGMFPATSGDAFVRGLSLSQDLAQIRHSLGVCPQHDTLFPELTVAQHLQLFGALKNVDPLDLQDEVERMIAEVGLVEKAHVCSGQLSGGMKRKLCLALALIGDSKVVFLDEPTSGMDPYSRRSTWSMLERNKKGRVILLTTHFMDEADLLGDRVAIMADGRLCCCGSSLFLKKHYGVGYTMVVVKREQTDDSTAIVDLVTQNAAGAQLTMEAGSELSFRVPFECSPSLPSLFAQLDSLVAGQDGQPPLLSTYGISVTTLEEVFMRVGEGREGPFPAQPLAPSTAGNNAFPTVQGGGGGETGNAENPGATLRAVNLTLTPPTSLTPNDSPAASQSDAFGRKTAYTSLGGGGGSKGTGKPSAPPIILDKAGGMTSEGSVFGRHMRALLVKRLITAQRDKKSQCFQLVVPACLILLGLVLIKAMDNPLVQPDLVLSPSAYNRRFPPSERNFVPVQTASPLGETVASYFNFNAHGGEVNEHGVYGSAVSVDPTTPDQFGQCARGAEALHSMSNFLIAPTVDRRPMRGSSVYGALSLSPKTAVDPVTGEHNFVYNLLLNATATHGVGVFMNLASNAILKAVTNNPRAEIVTHNHPLPLSYNEQRASASIAGNTASTFILIAFCFIPASYAIFIVKEAESKAKHQQVISGVSLLAYWLSNYVWDLASYLAPFAITISLLYAFGIKAYTSGQAAGATIAVLLAFAPAVASFTYVWSFLFKTHSAAQNVILFKNFLTGLVLSITSFVLSLIDSTRAVNLKLKYLFRLFPAFCLGEGLLNLCICIDDECPRFTPTGVDITNLLGPWDWDVTMADIVFLLVEAVVYFLLALAIEYGGTLPWLSALFARPGQYIDHLRGRFRRWRNNGREPEGQGEQGMDEEEGGEEDDDVAREEARVMGGGAGTDVVRLERLRKVYSLGGGRSKVAVRKLSFGVARGETLGFLGINGAGKTTTLSILSGEFPPTSGAAFIAGHDIATEQNKLRRKIGYCPQFSALLDALTVTEHLVLFARIKGVRESLIPGLVSAKVEEMGLSDFADKAAASLSGGNQRKLSVAIATMGEPPVLFLDEPSTGMDPVSRRHMWDVIAGIRARQNAIILTTHSMEEAEALCTRIAIMVNGRLMCIGTPQHLKSKFGEGFELEVKLRSPSSAELSSLCATLLLVPDGQVAPTQLPSIFAALGRPEWVTEISDRGSGSVLHCILQADGVLPTRSLAEWIVSQQRFDSLTRFLAEAFGENGAQLLERSGWFSCRYTLRPVMGGAGGVGGGVVSLAWMFERMEGGKERAGISEYSLGQTNVEAIFNRFAALQHNPEVRARDSTRALN